MIFERFRGQPRLNSNPDTGESLSSFREPVRAGLSRATRRGGGEGQRNPSAERKEVVSWTYDLSRCMFCGLCEEACSTNALELTQDYEMALYERGHGAGPGGTLECGARSSWARVTDACTPGPTSLPNRAGAHVHRGCIRPSGSSGDEDPGHLRVAKEYPGPVGGVVTRPVRLAGGSVQILRGQGPF